MKRLHILIATLLCFLVGACNSEGEGGTGTIEGKVKMVMHDKDDFSLSHDTLPAAKQDVYIIYGDDDFYGDDVECGPDGSYRFQYLNAGTYTLFSYSELASGEKVAVSQTVELKRGKTVTVPTLYIHKGKAYGTSSIGGQVKCVYFDKNGDVETTWALGERVYLQREGDNYYCDDARVGQDGYYIFTGVEVGDYTIYAISEDSDEVPYTVSTTISVSTTDSLYIANTITIRKKT